MILYIARHAWAGHYGDAGDWGDDSLRPLTIDGIERYRRVLSKLEPSGMRPESIATSPYTRCLQTAQLVAEVCGGQLTELEALALGTEPDPLIEWTNGQGAEQICWVGHNPDVGHLAAMLVGDGGSDIRFAKGAVAAICFRGDVEIGQGELYWLATAKLLGV